MKVRITCVNEFEIPDEFIDADGRLTHIAHPREVGGAKPLATPEPVTEALTRLLARPYFVAGSTPKQSTPWRVKTEQI